MRGWLTTRCLPRPQARGADPASSARYSEGDLAGPLSSRPLGGQVLIPKEHHSPLKPRSLVRKSPQNLRKGAYP